MPVGRLDTTGAAQPTSAIALTGAGWLVGLGCTAAILGTSYLRFGYHRPDLHLVLDSVDACIALLLAYLLAGRLRRTQRAQELLLVVGLVTLAVAGLGPALALQQLSPESRATVGVWLPAVLRTAGAAVMAAAALVPHRSLSSRHVRQGLAAPFVVVPLVAAVVWSLRDALPTAVVVTASGTPDGPDIEGHPVLDAAQALSAACFLFASLRFTHQARTTRDQMVTWLGPACALLGFARLNYLLFPSLYSGWLYTGDLLRTSGYAFLLWGAGREIRTYWATRADLAVAEDRRRLARELHDGVVQELSWIKSEARGLSHRLGDPADSEVCVQSILDASDRALDEARAAVDALGHDTREPLGYTLHRSARDVAERHGGRVVVDLDDSVRADQHQRHALARITREAVGNALRHGNPGCVRVTLQATPDGGRLVVVDDGHGFDVGSAPGACGYGLTSMQQRALALPGTFALESEPGGGTTVEVTW